MYKRWFFNKSRAITLRKIDRSKRKIYRHHHRILVPIYSKCHEILPASCIEMAANMDLSINQGQLTIMEITQSNKNINRHHHSMLVHIYFKFHEFLPTSFWEIAVNMLLFFKIKGNNSKENWPIQIFIGQASSQNSGSYLFQVSWISTN